MNLPTLADLQDEATWLEWRSLVPAAPRKVTELVTTEQNRLEFLEGCRLLRMDVRKRGGDGHPGPSPIQLQIADMLNAGHKFNGILESRRTAKTTTVEAVILGRCSLREDYQAGWTLAKKDGGLKVGERFKKDIVIHLDRLYPDKDTRPFRILQTNGSQHIYWPSTGSFFNVYSPKNEGFTSGGYDFAWVDEGQDADVELSASLMTSIPPTLDGRSGAQMVVTGTAGDWRGTNLLWSQLNNEKAGVLWHGVEDDLDPAHVEAWEPTEEFPLARVRDLITLTHAGLGFTTPLPDVEDNFHAMGRTEFLREYLGLWGTEGSNTALIPQPLWLEAARPMSEAEPAELSSLVVVVHPDADWGSLVQSWKTPDGCTHVALLHHQSGVSGFAKKVLTIARKLGRPLTYDSASQATELVMREIRDSRPPVQERALITKDVRRAAIHFMNLLREGKLRHHDQVEMNGAAETAVKRVWTTGNGWSFGRPKGNDSADITPIEAAALAVYAVEDEKAFTKPSIDFF